ncbi:ssDNA endodeoxyribonuclease [Clydaea vesicula]|uniref:SsDNA endodeoxyribonuclease n=1 Tax=Clydaea vesicula TaxID=447962 RepID=A0AAD5XT54_9FUNG|nr:ssDNA endodeoxyribonuclease [Clydaea vesicula]KAJ3378724.1 ssDNA endodeoxyribonuclease [Lobulomyces angularis]
MKSTFLLATLFCSISSLTDYHKTSLQLYNQNKLNDAGRFAVEVQRLDYLSNEKNEVVAEKLSDIILSFDVKLDNNGEPTVLANVTVFKLGVPVELGLNNVQIEAGVVMKMKEGERPETAESFDVGLIDLQVQVIAEQVDLAGLVDITRLTIIEKVTEVNGVEVVQSETMQQVFEIKEHKISSKLPCKAMHPKMAIMGSHSEEGTKPSGCNAQRLLQWIESKPLAVKIVFNLLSGIFLGILTLIFFQIMYKLFTFAGYQRVSDEDDDGKILKNISLSPKEVEAGYFLEKENLPKYNDRVQANLDLPKNYFKSFKTEKEDGSDEEELELTFGFDLSNFLTCLGVFENLISSLRITCPKDLSELVLTMEDKGNITVATIKTFEAEIGDDLNDLFTDFPIIGSIIIQAEYLKETFLELDVTSENVFFSFNNENNKSFFKIFAKGLSGEADIKFNKNSEVVENFNCQRAISATYKLNQLHTSFKALSLSTKICIRINKKGFLSFQLMIPKNLQMTNQSYIFSEYIFSPMVDNELDNESQTDAVDR